MLVSVVFPSDFVFFSLPKIIISMLRKKGGQTSRPLSLSLCNHHHHHHGRHQWWPSSLNECTWLTITLHYTRLDRLQTAADQCRLCVFWLSRSVSGHDLCPFFCFHMAMTIVNNDNGGGGLKARTNGWLTTTHIWHLLLN